ncbi:MAG: hypothetical protein KDI32_13770 [Pseudomonadales bacterium]|nr:hypothetical protein [Pseudomonadales bacterium]
MQKTIVAVAIGALALTACASTGDLAKKNGEEAQFRYMDYAGEPVKEFRSFRLDGWTPVARDKLVVWTGVNEAYLIKVWDSCRDLQFANHVGVTSTGNTVSTFEKVRVGRETCPISEIRPVDIRRMKADRREAALAKKAAD